MKARPSSAPSRPPLAGQVRDWFLLPLARASKTPR